jgi:hypothetical protein
VCERVHVYLYLYMNVYTLDKEKACVRESQREPDTESNREKQRRTESKKERIRGSTL